MASRVQAMSTPSGQSLLANGETPCNDWILQGLAKPCRSATETDKQSKGTRHGTRRRLRQQASPLIRYPMKGASGTRWASIRDIRYLIR
jgi:hypothetical protein